MPENGIQIRRPKAVIHGIGTALPEDSKPQNEILELFLAQDHLHTTTGSETKKRDEFVRAVYAGSMIEKRHYATRAPFQLEKDIGSTMRVHLDLAIPLTVEASKKAMKEAGVEPKDIKRLIFVSSTGLTAPGIESFLMEELGLERDTTRANVIFMGCAAALTALNNAKEFCLDNPEQMCLIVSLELFSLHLGHDGGNDMAVYMSLFGDGCAAVVVSGEYGSNTKDKWSIEGNYSYLIPDSATAITMGLMEKGLTGTLEPRVPNVIQKKMKGFMDGYHSKFGIDGVDHWCIHPGGPAIIKAVQTALELPDEKLEHSWECLKKYGNMSSATILFILDRMRKFKETKKDDNMIMLAFGPGVWVESLFLIKQ